MTTSNEHNNAPSVPQDSDPTSKEQYRRMFVAACEALGAISDVLGCDPEDGGAEPILGAVEELHIGLGLSNGMLGCLSAAPAVPQGLRDFLTELSKQKPEKPDYWSSCGQCERNSSTAEDLLAATPAPAPAQGEPFGYFRAEPFGWTDCAEDDEGAIALYERPQEVGLTDEALDNLIEDLSEWSRHVVEDTAHQTLEAHVREVLAKNPIIAALRAKGGKHV